MLLTRPFAFIWAGADGTQESPSQCTRPLSATAECCRWNGSNRDVVESERIPWLVSSSSWIFWVKMYNFLFVVYLFLNVQCSKKIEKADYNNFVHVGFICHHGARTWPRRSRLLLTASATFCLAKPVGAPLCCSRKEREREKKKNLSKPQKWRVWEKTVQSCRHNFYHYLLLNGAV